MGAEHSTSKSAPPTDLFTRKHSVRRSKKPLLTNLDRKLIRDSWIHINQEGSELVERLFREAWLRASHYSPQWVWENLAGVCHSASAMCRAESNLKFAGIVHQVYEFLNMLIHEDNLAMETVREKSLRLGERHLKYFDDGFHVGYWDSFSVSMVEAIEVALTSKPNEEDSAPRRTIFVWHKFMRFIVDRMQEAYLLAREKRQREQGGKEKLSTGVPFLSIPTPLN